jgi:hypothetical protein
VTHFEFVSVAVSLIFALAVADILRALIPAARSPARYWPHFMWLIAMVLNIAYSWWAIWNVRGVSWTGLLFVYVLLNPALLTIMARLLTHRDPDSLGSFRDHFHNNSRPFFAVLFAFCVNGFVASWVFGSHPLGTLSTLQMAALPGAAGSIAGVLLRTDRAHTILVIFALVLLVAALVLTPVLPISQPAA